MVISIYGIFTVLIGAVYLIPLFGQNLSLSGTVNALFMKNSVFLFGHNIVTGIASLGPHPQGGLAVGDRKGSPTPKV